MEKLTARRNRILAVIIFFCLLSLTSYSIFTGNGFFGLGRDSSGQGDASTVCAVIPKPVSYLPSDGTFQLTSTTFIVINGRNEAETEELYQIAEYFLSIIRPSTGYSLSIQRGTAAATGSILLSTEITDASIGAEGYCLDVTSDHVMIQASEPQGIFHGIQTLRQLLPPEIENASLITDVIWSIPCASITDAPVYEWRGMMLDTARHFIPVNDVKHLIDLMAEYKLNRLHLHLTDDQGWRIEIKSRPDLTAIGGSTEIGGGSGGFYTQDEYTEIIQYAAKHYITIIPEIEMPGHCNAALASYAELNPEGIPKILYTGTEVGFSTFMCHSEFTYELLEDVIRELAALTPGDYLHIGGDEAASTSMEDYDYFISRVKEITDRYGKKTIGWNPYDTVSGVTSEDLLQNWNKETDSALEKGMKIILSPSEKAYLDMKYNITSPLGLEWAGYTNTKDGYEWDPADYVPVSSAIGVEGTLWSETIETIDDIEYLAFPRLLGLSEIGWTPVSDRSWNEYQDRLMIHGNRMDYQGINYYKDPVVNWQD